MRLVVAEVALVSILGQVALLLSIPVRTSGSDVMCEGAASSGCCGAPLSCRYALRDLCRAHERYEKFTCLTQKHKTFG